MAYYSLPIGKFHKKTETKKLAKNPASYGKTFYKTLTDPFDKSFDTLFQRDIISKHLAMMLKIIFLQQVILEKVCKMTLICTSLGIG